MNEDAGDLIRQLQEQDGEAIRNTPPPENPMPRSPDLPDAEAGSPVGVEWNLYRQEVGRLLSQGCRGKYALVKRGQQLTVWDTLRDAVQAGEMLYGAGGALVQQISPSLKVHRVGYNRPCRD